MNGTLTLLSLQLFNVWLLLYAASLSNTAASNVNAALNSNTKMERIAERILRIN